MSKYLTVIGLILMVSLPSFAQSKQTMAALRGERLINALVNSKTLPGNFGDDGVFFEGTGMKNGEKSPDVIWILKLGKKAIPLLIEHLDDKRLFKHLTFCCLANQQTPQKVMVKEVALDILTVIVRRNKPMFDLKCINEGTPEDRCVAEKFYEGKRGKRHWQKAYRAGKIRYEKYDDGSNQ